jgi:hypothetical protein
MFVLEHDAEPSIRQDFVYQPFDCDDRLLGQGSSSKVPLIRRISVWTNAAPSEVPAISIGLPSSGE